MDTQVHIEKIITEEQVEVLTVRWNADDTLLAIGCSDGTIKIHSSQGLLNDIHSEGYPITSVRWKPPVGKTKNILLATSSDGSYFQFHGPSGRVMHSERLSQNQIFASDYSPDSTHLALGCKDCKIRIVDDCTKTVVHTLGPPEGYSSGHTSRIYGVRWPMPFVLISAGWDNKVIFWDVRSPLSQRVILGPHICGDALDFKDGVVLTGSYFKENQVQLWNFEDGRNLYSGGLQAQGKDCLVYTAQFSKRQDGFLVGGSGSDEAYFFANNPVRPLAILENFSKPVYSADFCNTSNSVAIGCGDGTTAICSIDLTNPPLT